VAGPGMDAEDRASELISLALMSHLARVEDAVPAIEPAVGAPGQRVGQLVGVGPAEAGDDHLALVGPAVAVGVTEEKDIRSIGNPDPAVSHGDPRRDVQSFGEDAEPISPAVSIRVLENLDAIAPRAGLLARILQALGHPDPSALVERHRHRVDDVGFAGDE